MVFSAGGDDLPRPIGSILKPFLLRAWVSAHPNEALPRVRCFAGSSCWRPSGHGEVGAERALAVSCNVYFRTLAEQIPADVLTEAFRSDGFLVPEPTTPELAIGLETATGSIAARPSSLLRAFARLVNEPWPGAEPGRTVLRAGLRDAALSGTASGLARAGFFAKTGTVPALDGAALATSGWVVAVDETNEAYLGLLPRGTGREAALALGRSFRLLRSGAGAPHGIPERMPPTGGLPGTERVTDGVIADIVRVRMLEVLLPRRLTATNAGRTPQVASSGYVGPSGTVELRAGGQLGSGAWKISAPEWNLWRRLTVRGIRVEAAPNDRLRLVADVTVRDYVQGVMAAESANLDTQRTVDLAAAILRFLARGPRHGAVDVCDSTHCAWFVGLGPRVLWPSPRRPILLDSGGDEALVTLDEVTWQRAREASKEPGPASWTASCGGSPLSSHAVWGSGDRTVWRCPRHPRPSSVPWVREWPAKAIEAAFGPGARTLSLEPLAGTWTLRVDTTRGPGSYSFDAAHSRLAAILGWDAMPSPADRLSRTPSGYRVEGVGSGHRVGLCLGD